MSKAKEPNFNNEPILSLDDAEMQAWGHQAGFSHVTCHLIETAPFSLTSSTALHYQTWLDQAMHGDMSYLEQHVALRFDPTTLLQDAATVISCRMNYLPLQALPWGNVTPRPHRDQWRSLGQDEVLPSPILGSPPVGQAYVSWYARGRDYHKVMRKALLQLAQKLHKIIETIETSHLGSSALPSLAMRVTCDSAPVLEVAWAAQSHLGWRGKNTLLIHPDAGSAFFLGQILINRRLKFTPPPPPPRGQCGNCTACLDVCPTQAFIKPYVLDARRCLSYLTIEHEGSIPVALRPRLGQRVYGCDDCQIVCPWNRWAQPSEQLDFLERPMWKHHSLQELLHWDEVTFLRLTEGSPVRRIGHRRWQRNVAVVIGNTLTYLNHQLTTSTPHPTPPSTSTSTSTSTQHFRHLRQNLLHALHHTLAQTTDPLIQEHLQWAMAMACTHTTNHQLPP